MEPEFFVQFFRQRWECGSGCCSNAWHDVDVYCDGKLVYSRSEVLGLYSEIDAEVWAHDFIQSDYEFEKDSYKLKIDY